MRVRITVDKTINVNGLCLFSKYLDMCFITII